MIQVVAFSVEPELAFSTGPSVAIFAEPEQYNKLRKNKMA